MKDQTIEIKIKMKRNHRNLYRQKVMKRVNQH